MKHSEYRELLPLADALTFVAESDLLSAKLREAGYSPSSFDFEILIKVVADNIHRNLTE